DQPGVARGPDQAGCGNDTCAQPGPEEDAMKRRLRCLAIVLALAMLAPAAFAQGKRKATAKSAPAKTDTAEPAEGDGATKVKVERGTGGRKVYKIQGEIVIEGKIQKPEAFYVLQKSSINYDWHELKQEFVPKILDSVTKAPF
ncbi:MAG: hypothetical protein WBP56_00950, partial [Polyangia bacterium]